MTAGLCSFCGKSLVHYSHADCTPEGEAAREEQCGVYWGSHGCTLPPHDDGHHICEACCSPGDAEHMAAHAAAPEDQYGVDGCAGTYPYYGRKNMTSTPGLMFFTIGPDYDDLPGEFDRLLTPKDPQP